MDKNRYIFILCITNKVMNLEILEKFGITPTEAKVYTSIFGLKNIPIGYIIKKTGLHRGTIYNSLNNLIRKGLRCL
jgi:sugar-specific transcriptional regulator TrmB